jgi:hypothetical protein
MYIEEGQRQSQSLNDEPNRQWAESDTLYLRTEYHIYIIYMVLCTESEFSLDLFKTEQDKLSLSLSIYKIYIYHMSPRHNFLSCTGILGYSDLCK